MVWITKEFAVWPCRQTIFDSHQYDCPGSARSSPELISVSDHPHSQRTLMSAALITNLCTSQSLCLHWEFSFLVDLFHHLIYSKPYSTFLSLLFNTVLGILKYLLSHTLIITVEYLTYVCLWSMYLPYIISLTLTTSCFTFNR